LLGGYSHEEKPMLCPERDVELTVASSAGQMNATTAEIDGIVDAIYRESDSRYIGMSIEKAQQLLSTSSVSFYSVQLKRPDDFRSVTEKWNDEFKKRNLLLKATHWKEHPYGELYVQSIDFLNVFRYFTLIVTLAIVSLSVFSMLTRLIQERTKEIGTLRCLGFRPSRIRILFLIEALFLSILGNVVGLVLAMMIAPALNSLGILYKVGILSEKIPFRIQLPWSHLWISAILLAIIAMTAASIAIQRSLWKKIPDCLAQH